MTVMTKKTIAAACLTLMAAASVQAQEQAQLAGGARLKLDKEGLALLDAAGRQRAMLPLRAKQLDQRSTGGRGIALVLDAGSGHVLPLRFDAVQGTLTAQGALPSQSFGVESACLFRDRQGLDFAFIAAK